MPQNVKKKREILLLFGGGEEFKLYYFKKREKIRAEAESFILLLHHPLLRLAPISQMTNFSVLEWTSLQAGNVVTHNDPDETLDPLVWAVWITRGERPRGGGQLCLNIILDLKTEGYSQSAEPDHKKLMDGAQPLGGTWVISLLEKPDWSPEKGGNFFFVTTPVPHTLAPRLQLWGLWLRYTLSFWAAGSIH